MARKPDSYYFDNFKAAAANNSKAAALLEDVMRNYDPDALEPRMAEMQQIEHSNDELRHEMLDALVSAFITPIEREDLAQLSGAIDDITDCIEGVLHRLYYNNVREVAPGALEMVAMLVQACDEVEKLVDELPNFKKSKTLGERVVSINAVEGKADDVFIRIMRELHTSETDALRLVATRETYMCLEYAVDACEHVADLIGGIVMKNS
jgi:uncharacterized protein